MRVGGAHAMMAGAVAIGGVSLALFGWFLVFGPIPVADLQLSEAERLIWDAGLSLLFFLQHSVMVRRRVQAAMAGTVPEPYYPTFYAIASGIFLLAVVLLWQPSAQVWYRLELPFSLAPRLISLLALVGFVWAVRALGRFDPFGLDSIRNHLRGRTPRPSDLTVRGPYLHVRHPLYSLILVLTWSTPWLSADRLLFDLLWTGWMVVATHLEERDLVAYFGDAYRRYQRAVPMLVPWHMLARVGSWRMPGTRDEPVEPDDREDG